MTPRKGDRGQAQEILRPLISFNGLNHWTLRWSHWLLLPSEIRNCEINLWFIHIAGGLRWWCHWDGLTGQLFLKSLTEYYFALVILFQESISQLLKFRSIGFIVCNCWGFFFVCFSVSQDILTGAAVHFLLVEDLLLKLEGSITSKWALNCGSWYSLFL